MGMTPYQMANNDVEESQTYFSVAEEQGNTGHTLVLTGSLGIQGSVCWRNKTGTPPKGIIYFLLILYNNRFQHALLSYFFNLLCNWFLISYSEYEEYFRLLLFFEEI